MHNGVLKGIRGPHGGYKLVCDQKGVTVSDILRAAGTVDEEEEELKSEIVTKVVLPVLFPAEQAFGQALNEIKLDDMVRYAEPMATGQVRDESRVEPDESRREPRRPVGLRRPYIMPSVAAPS